MNIHFMVRMTAPVVAISVFLLAVVIFAAWLVQRWKTVSQDLRANAVAMRAAEELEILVYRGPHTQLYKILSTGNRKYLAQRNEGGRAG
jgi:hypothetical protein